MKYLGQFSEADFLTAMANFHLLLFLATSDVVPLRVSQQFSLSIQITVKILFCPQLRRADRARLGRALQWVSWQYCLVNHIGDLVV